MMYDVIIIGSGPAGVAAAVTCANQGLQTMIVTKFKKEDHALRASESVHPGVSSLLKKINAGDCIEQSTRGLYEGIQNGENYSPLGSDENGKWHGSHIDRNIFDDRLLKAAQQQGVSIATESVAEFLFENERVTGIKTSLGKIYTAKYIIDASGRKRIAGKKLKFKERFLSPPLVAWTGVSTGVDDPGFSKPIAQFIPSENGWTWLAPENDGRCSWTKLSLKGKPITPPHELSNFELAGNVQVFNVRWRLFRPVCSEGIILCGDAAGILDPAAGQGILNALLSGIYAGQAAIACVRQPELQAFHLAQYDDWFLDQFLEKAEHLRHYYEMSIYT